MFSSERQDSIPKLQESSGKPGLLQAEIASSGKPGSLQAEIALLKEAVISGDASLKDELSELRKEVARLTALLPQKKGSVSKGIDEKMKGESLGASDDIGKLIGEVGGGGDA